MTGIATTVRGGEVEAPDVLVGGTPCQAFSIAGLRNGLADKRGQLSLSYVELANAIDDKRRERGEEEAIIVWENVPGVLSSKDNAFGCFIGALAGESCELQPAGGKWSNAGCVYGPSRIVAWRVLDAQFFGVAQRRRRVFVVASARKEFDPAEVLFEFDSLRRDTQPRREPQTAVTTDTGSGIEGGSHWDNPANPHPTLNQSNNIGGIGASNQEVFSQRGDGLVSGAYSDISRTLLAKENDSTAEDLDTYILAYGGGNTGGNIDVATACTAHGVRMDFDTETFAVHGTQDPDTNHELAHTLGRNHGQENVIITEPYTIAIRGREEGSTVEVRNDGTANALLTPNGGRAGMGVGAVGWGMQVRRLTPVECERLQGFPDNHTLISWRGKDAADCPDGQRYKAIGNSMAVPVMRWIGERIAEALPIQEPTPRRWQRPFLKWAGGKYSLLPELERLIPAGKRLIEPFVGGGSVFLNSDKHERFLLADINADLINLYQMLAVAPDSVIAEAIKAFRHLNDAENYTAIREAFNAWQLNATERAAAFLYLNRHCFNGLMRYNLDGFFNVGWGKYKAPYFPEKELMAFRKKSSACVFMNAGFERTLRLAGDGDVVYCDPPYEPMPGTAGFTSYASGGFSWDSQVALAESCVAAHQRGAKVFISNSTAPRVIELYERHGFTLHRVNARRSISSKGSTRETANDIVASLGI
ncbi:Dam family site-specific DNA-(adenine-N6)-methyltransferase [Salmonella enterica]|nr:Dam family site-specific DNA-(adenine-N6)-methyltransferase [Salmonella enterica]